MTECNQSTFQFASHFSRQVVARFDGGTLTTDSGGLLNDCGGSSGRRCGWRRSSGVKPASQHECSNVIEITFGTNAPDTRHFANMRTYMSSQRRDWLTRGSIDQNDRLETDLTGPWFHHNQRDQLVLESKDEMKKRGLDSPDDGDALALTFARHVAPLSHQDDEEEEQEYASYSRGGNDGFRGGWMR